MYRYREANPDGSKRHASIIVGTLEEFPTKALAWKAAEILRISANPDNPAQMAVTLGAVAERFKKEELPELRHSTQCAYSSYMNEHIIPKWGEYKLIDVRPFGVELWLKSLPLAAKTKGSILNVMRTLFNTAMRWELMVIQDNPMKLVRVRGVSKRDREPRVLTVEEFHRLIAQLEEPYSTMVTLAMATGLRCSELFALKWCDFDWLGGTMFVRRAIVDGVVDDVKTRYSKSKLPLHPSLTDMLLRWKNVITEFNGEDDFVFASWRTLGKLPFRPTAVLEDFIKPAAERAELGLIGWHTFRRSYSTLLRTNGTDIKTQQSLLRHADVRTTMNLYTADVPEAMRQAHNSVAEMVVVQ